MTAASKQSVKIAIQRPTSTPAVFLVASFTEPAWEPIELEAKPVTSTDGTSESYEFSKTFDIAEGKYEYRFRLGSDDTWFCRTDALTSADEHGNMNNILLVAGASDSSTEDRETEESKSKNATDNTVAATSDELTESVPSAEARDASVVDKVESENSSALTAQVVEQSDGTAAAQENLEGSPEKPEEPEEKDGEVPEQGPKTISGAPTAPSTGESKGNFAPSNVEVLKFTRLAGLSQRTEPKTSELKTETDKVKAESVKSDKIETPPTQEDPVDPKSDEVKAEVSASSEPHEPTKSADHSPESEIESESIKVEDAEIAGLHDVERSTDVSQTEPPAPKVESETEQMNVPELAALVDPIKPSEATTKAVSHEKTDQSDNLKQPVEPEEAVQPVESSEPIEAAPSKETQKPLDVEAPAQELNEPTEDATTMGIPEPDLAPTKDKKSANDVETELMKSEDPDLNCEAPEFKPVNPIEPLSEPVEEEDFASKDLPNDMEPDEPVSENALITDNASEATQLEADKDKVHDPSSKVEEANNSTKGVCNDMSKIEKPIATGESEKQSEQGVLDQTQQAPSEPIESAPSAADANPDAEAAHVENPNCSSAEVEALPVSNELGSEVASETLSSENVTSEGPTEKGKHIEDTVEGPSNTSIDLVAHGLAENIKPDDEPASFSEAQDEQRESTGSVELVTEQSSTDASPSMKDDEEQDVEATSTKPPKVEAKQSEPEIAEAPIEIKTAPDSDDVPLKEPIFGDEDPSEGSVTSTGGTTPLESVAAGEVPKEEEADIDEVAVPVEAAPQEKVSIEDAAEDVPIVSQKIAEPDSQASDDIIKRTDSAEADAEPQAEKQSADAKQDQEVRTSIHQGHDDGSEIETVPEAAVKDTVTAELTNEDKVIHTATPPETAPDKDENVSAQLALQEPIEQATEPLEPPNVVENEPIANLAAVEKESEQEDLAEPTGSSEARDVTDVADFAPVVSSNKEAGFEPVSVSEPPAATESPDLEPEHTALAGSAKHTEDEPHPEVLSSELEAPTVTEKLKVTDDKEPESTSSRAVEPEVEIVKEQNDLKEAEPPVLSEPASAIKDEAAVVAEGEPVITVTSPENTEVEPSDELQEKIRLADTQSETAEPSAVSGNSEDTAIAAAGESVSGVEEPKYAISPAADAAADISEATPDVKAVIAPLDDLPDPDAPTQHHPGPELIPTSGAVIPSHNTEIPVEFPTKNDVSESEPLAEQSKTTIIAEPEATPAESALREEPEAGLDVSKSATVPGDSEVIKAVSNSNDIAVITPLEPMAESISEPRPLPLAAEPISQATEPVPKAEVLAQEEYIAQSPLQTHKPAPQETFASQPLELTPASKSEPATLEHARSLVENKPVDYDLITKPSSEERTNDLPVQTTSESEHATKTSEQPESVCKAIIPDALQKDTPPEAALKPVKPIIAENKTTEEDVPQATSTFDTQDGPKSAPDADTKMTAPASEASATGPGPEPASAADRSEPAAQDTSKPLEPPTANQSVSSLTTQKREGFLRSLWRAVFFNLFGGLFGIFRRRESPRQ
ncbi:hypothetical protein PRK78_006652 [Emydomyces testavorans]|uniref:AMP-activated protein kinase glycogen-binding domain-containing protein n=1 Tax=Emydomyces testavorans TaxID=2070801 RepID=A0AAF0DNV3_9EURO|nr:hypothetical protein PRK78_006652 [Emydomyces testavorans]